jgi:hypothetical protein
MTTPVVSLTKLLFKGRRLTIEGKADFGGEAGTVAYYLDPLPSGTSIGPTPLSVDAASTFTQTNIPIGNGRWKVRVVATPTTGAAVEISSTELSINSLKGRVVLPLGGGEISSSLPETNTLKIVDTYLRSLYSTAISAGTVGNKRASAAGSIVGGMNNRMRLDIYRNRRLIIRAEYSAILNVVNDGTNVFLKLPPTTKAVIYESADLDTGSWTFELQGGPNYSRSITGRAGPGNPSDHITLSASPIAGAGFNADFSILLQRSMDGLT